MKRKNLAFLALLCNHKAEIADAVATFFPGETSSKILLGFTWLPDLSNNDMLPFLPDLEVYIATSPFCIAVVLNCHPEAVFGSPETGL